MKLGPRPPFRRGLFVSNQTPAVLAEKVQNLGIEMERQAVAGLHLLLAGKDGDQLLAGGFGVDDGFRSQFLDKGDPRVQPACGGCIGETDVLRSDADADPLAHRARLPG